MYQYRWNRKYRWKPEVFVNCNFWLHIRGKYAIYISFDSKFYFWFDEVKIFEIRPRNLCEQRSRIRIHDSEHPLLHFKAIHDRPFLATNDRPLTYYHFILGAIRSVVIRSLSPSDYFSISFDWRICYHPNRSWKEKWKLEKIQKRTGTLVWSTLLTPFDPTWVISGTRDPRTKTGPTKSTNDRSKRHIK